MSTYVDVTRMFGLVVIPRVLQAAEGRPICPPTHVRLARVFKTGASVAPAALVLAHFARASS